MIRFVGESTPNHISCRAMDIQAGQGVLKAGTRIGPQHVGVLASVGCVQLLRGQAAEGGHRRDGQRNSPSGGQARPFPDPQLEQR